MATVINNPDTSADHASGLGVALGVLIAIILAILLFVYALPAFRGGQGGGSTPSSSSSTEINVPEKVQLDVNTPK